MRRLLQVILPLSRDRTKLSNSHGGSKTAPNSAAAVTNPTMKITRLETWTLSVPYIHDEISSRVARSGVTDTIVRLTADNGLVGWGECTSGPNAASIEQAVRSGIPDRKSVV